MVPGVSLRGLSCLFLRASLERSVYKYWPCSCNEPLLKECGGHAAALMDGALAGNWTGEATMPPENNLDEFEMALHQAWEVLRGRARVSSNDVVHSAETSKEHISQDHTDSDESDAQSAAAG